MFSDRDADGQAGFEMARGRLVQVFRFLQDLNDLRHPVVSRIQEQRWVLWMDDLPDQPSIRRGVRVPKPEGNGEAEEADGALAGAAEADDFVLRVARPRLTPPPSPPDAIRDWIEEGWQRVDGAILARESRNEIDGNETRLVRFDEDPERVRVLAEWRDLWGRWAINEKPARNALRVFERLYSLHGEIDRESERVELVVGDGVLRWDGGPQLVHHPVLLQRLQLQFDPEKPEFIVREVDAAPELYVPLLRSLGESVDGRAVGHCREELARGGYHPLGEDDTSGFLKRAIHTLFPEAGEYVEADVLAKSCLQPVLFRRPVIFLRGRTLGFSKALGDILDDLPHRDDLPPWMRQIVGIEAEPDGVKEQDAPTTPVFAPEEVLFSKPSNTEQSRIAQRLAQYGCVLVQGPPGTGKTHTIANLIGHLLAQGKSVLVTAHTAKALRVLRDKVVDPLRPLCISVLENDLEGREQLEAAVQGILKRLNDSADLLEEQAMVLTRQRRDYLREHRETWDRILTARQEEHTPVVVGGVDYAPKDAAKAVAENAEVHSWLPGPVTYGAVLPLSEGEVLELYRTNVQVSVEDERELEASLPATRDLLPPPAFEEFMAEYRRISSLQDTTVDGLWEPRPEQPAPEKLERLADYCAKALAPFESAEAWRLEAVQAGRHGGASREPWDDFLQLIEDVWQEAQRARRLILAHGPTLDASLPVSDQVRVLEELVAHVGKGGGLGFLNRTLHAAWKSILAKAKVAGEPPRKEEHFQALLALARLNVSRKNLLGRWERLMTQLGAEPPDRLGERPEEACRQAVGSIRACLDWHDKMWAPVLERFRRYGFRWEAHLNQTPPNLSTHGDLLRLRDAFNRGVPDCLRSRANWIRMGQLQARHGELRAQLAAFGGETGAADVVDRLRLAVENLDADAYGQAFGRLADLERKQEVRKIRRELLLRLETVAPEWAKVVRSRLSPHDGSEPPGRELKQAWLWRQLHDELERRAETAFEALQARAEELADQTLEVTAELVDRKAWAGQIRRTRVAQRQALVGWRDTVKRMGKGYTRRLLQLQRHAREQMAEARSAVPVWIMPLSRVVENFDVTRTRFDVVIIDEASQSDAMALIALYMAREVVVVGDNEQVSPDPVGKSLDEIQNLIRMHLQDVPHAPLYDGQTSMYELVERAWESHITLREHFRCAPEIIHFSNDLAYFQEEKRLIPLRDVSAVPTKPHVVAHRVEGAFSDDKVNEEEALTVASLIAAAIEQPEYRSDGDGKPATFGVISMVGDEQARRIYTLLHEHLPETEIHNRRILCGNPAHFQGDERDVVFLSMVDGPPEKGLLRLRDDDRFKKRFNVAASRARNQMWVVYSMNAERDLQADDLRKRLINYALTYREHIPECEKEETKVESEFERLVCDRLKRAHYRVQTQWKVGRYRIDLVVTGANEKKLAIECDGERSHPLEKLQEDSERQARLERQGWKFVRIRSSLFFRDPERAMRPVFSRLRELGITPDGASDEVAGADSEGAELRDRVLRRAQELRLQWRQPRPEDEVAEVLAEARAEERTSGQATLSTVEPA